MGIRDASSEGYSSDLGSLVKQGSSGFSDGGVVKSGHIFTNHEDRKIMMNIYEAQHVPRTCLVRAPYVLRTCPVRAPYVPRTCPARLGSNPDVRFRSEPQARYEPSVAKPSAFVTSRSD